jgi:putative drug exporter of the RND superfamily
MASHAADLASRASLRVFQVVAVAEGGLLPAILTAAIFHWITGRGAGVVAVVGALHGIAFTVYVLLTPIVAGLLHWPARTLSVAISVAFVPFAPWAFERGIRADLTRCVARHRPGRGPAGAART